MNSRCVSIPHLNANDDHADLTRWACKDRAHVNAGDVIAVIETSKATLDVEAPVAGYCAHLVQAGERISVGATIAVLLENPEQAVSEFLSPSVVATADLEPSWTKKAEITAKKNGVDIRSLALALARQVTEQDVLDHNHAARGKPIQFADVADDLHPANRQERVLLIGGGAGGGAVALDSIFRTTHQRAIGILDNNPQLHGKTQFGVPILGGNNMAGELWKQGYFDAAIVVVTASIVQRKALFDELRDQGIPLTNVIDPSVQIRANVKMGVGNLIMANGFFATCVTVGDNNFFASHACIEHHSTVGDHCTFGPRTTTSGAVTIDDQVKCGMGVLIEPYLKIGRNALIPSGCVVTAHVPADSVIKMQNIQSVKPR